MMNRLTVGLVATLCSACALTNRQPRAELALIYNAAAQHHGPDRNPIIAIPGILGSKLYDPASGITVWGAFEPEAASPDDPDGARLIALPIEGTASLRDLRDDVLPHGVLDKVRIKLLGIPLQIQAYAGILATLGAGGYRDEALGLGGQVDYGDGHFTCFQFDYDWRRDNVENAQRLHAFILEKREYVRQQYAERYGVENAEVKFDIAAHSMGGLVTRYFLRYGSQDLPTDGSLPDLTWEGAKYVERVILVGPPNAGSADALMQLVLGKKMGPLLPYFPAALLGTFHTPYQLLPRTRHAAAVFDGDRDRPADLFDAGLWERMGWGLASSKQASVLEVLMPDVPDPDERRARALAFQRRVLARAAAFQRALDRPTAAPGGLEIRLVAGDAIPTAARVSIDSHSGALEVLESGPGDSVVLRSSALLDERVGQSWTPQVQTPIDFGAVLFLPHEHLALTKSEVFRDNVLFWLLEEPRADRPR